jgi:hypothetical protein
MIPISYSKWHFYYNSWLIGAVLTNLAIPNWGATKCTRSDSCETLQIVTGWCGFRHSPSLLGMISRYVKWRKQPFVLGPKPVSACRHPQTCGVSFRAVASQMLISRQGLDTLLLVKNHIPIISHQDQDVWCLYDPKWFYPRIGWLNSEHGNFIVGPLVPSLTEPYICVLWCYVPTFWWFLSLRFVDSPPIVQSYSFFNFLLIPLAMYSPYHPHIIPI